MKGIIKYIILFCLVFASTCGLAYYGVSLFTNSHKSVILPNFIDKNIIYALETMTKMGLNPKLMGTLHHDTIKEYNITFQNPEPGTIIKTGRDVLIYVSKGRQQITLPNLIRMPLREANLILEKQGFETGVISKTFSPIVPRDHIIAQSPRALTKIYDKRICHLLVSKGPEPVSMPGITGLPLEKGISILSDNGLEHFEIKEKISTRILRGKILDQQPAKGKPVSVDTPITIITGSRWNIWEDISHSNLILSHTLPFGFLKKRIQIQVEIGGVNLVLMDEYAAPGKKIDLMLPFGVNALMLIFVDGKLVREKHISSKLLKLQNTPPWEFLKNIPRELWIKGDFP